MENTRPNFNFQQIILNIPCIVPENIQTPTMEGMGNSRVG